MRAESFGDGEADRSRVGSGGDTSRMGSGGGASSEFRNCGSPSSSALCSLANWSGHALDS